MTFLESVVRIFRQLAIIRGDTDAPTSFSDTQHNASLQLAQIAVQNELIKLISERLIPKERKTSGAITFVATTRTYDLASDFLRFYGEAHIHDVTRNIDLFPWRGGLEALQMQDINYTTAPGMPNWWYFEPVDSTNKKIGFYTVPNGAGNAQYDYEASTLVSVATDNLPFHNSEEAYSFTDMAGRRFKYMFEDTKAAADIELVLEKDFSYKTARATLYQLLRGTNPRKNYGYRYA